MTKIRLKPCPFCGGKAEYKKGMSGLYFIKCKCGATVSFDNAICNNQPDKAAEHYNRRTADVKGN